MGNKASSPSRDPRDFSSGRHGSTSRESHMPQPQRSGRYEYGGDSSGEERTPYPPQQQKNYRRQISKKYQLIGDNYKTVEEVQQALLHAGLESSNLIVGIDFTKSNEWLGKHSFGGRSLHTIGNEVNPYEKALAIIGRTLSAFDDDNEIPCFGFGDVSTHDKHVFSFNSDHSPCEGFEGALERYRRIVPHLRLAGPTSFAPVINAAVDIVEESGGQYHILIIIADGQVTRSVDTPPGQMSPQEVATVNAIVNASSYPLSIVVVGVGDGPWDMMQQFDDSLPSRSFDNFQFVNFTQIMAKSGTVSYKEAAFALAALMEIPDQYKAIQDLGMLSRSLGRSPGVKPLPPPPRVLELDGHRAARSRPAGYGVHQDHGPTSGPPATARDPFMRQPPNPYEQYEYPGYYNYASQPSAPAARSFPPQRTPDVDANSDCPVCLTDKKDLAFNCGHQTCRQCANSLTNCPICREIITQRIRLY